MEEYINLKTVIKNEIYNTFEGFIKCPLCSGIIINPVMCMKCQNAFCKKCAEDWSRKDSKCKNGCLEPNYQKCLGKKDILSKLAFKCQKCQSEFQYDDAEKHSKNCEPKAQIITPLSNNTKTPQPKMEKLSEFEVDELKKNGIDILSVTGKKNIAFIYYLFN
jgi:hypothetical protein